MKKPHDFLSTCLRCHARLDFSEEYPGLRYRLCKRCDRELQSCSVCGSPLDWDSEHQWRRYKLCWRCCWKLQESLKALQKQPVSVEAQTSKLGIKP